MKSLTKFAFTKIIIYYFCSYPVWSCREVRRATMIYSKGWGLNSHPAQCFPRSTCGSNSMTRANARIRIYSSALYPLIDYEIRKNTEGESNQCKIATFLHHLATITLRLIHWLSGACCGEPVCRCKCNLKPRSKRRYGIIPATLAVYPIPC